MWDLLGRGRSRPRRLRRALTAGLGVGAVVATAAVAQAHSQPDGSSGPGAAAASLATSMDPTTRAGAGSDGMAIPGRKIEQGGTLRCPAGAMMSGGADDAGAHSWSGKRLPTSHWAASKQHLRTVVSPEDPTFTQLLGINDAGTVVGYDGSGADAAHPNRGFAVRPPYRSRDFTPRNVPGAAQTQDVGISRTGVEVGFAIGKDRVTRGVVRMDGGFRLVSHPASKARPAVDQLLGINSRGVAAGFYNDAAGASHGYLYDVCSHRFSPVRLPVPADSVQATGVNDSGAVSGFYTRGKVTRGFVLDHQRFTSIRLGNDTNTQALGIDAAGDVVGSYVGRDGHTHGYVRAAGRAWTVDVPRASDTVVNGLNDRGQLVGFSTTREHRTVGFIAW